MNCLISLEIFSCYLLSEVIFLLVICCQSRGLPRVQTRLVSPKNTHLWGIRYKFNSGTTSKINSFSWHLHLPPCFWEVWNTPWLCFFSYNRPTRHVQRSWRKNCRRKQKPCRPEFNGPLQFTALQSYGNSRVGRKAQFFIIVLFFELHFFSRCFLLIVSGMFWVVVSNMFLFPSRFWGNDPSWLMTNQMGWNHQLDIYI